MRNWLIWLILALPLLAIPLDRYEKAIASYEVADQYKAPEPGGTLFLGSSTFTLWGHELESEFARFHALNRAFGGSTIPEIDHYLDRICFPYRPRLIVFYAGSNDIAEGHPAEQVCGDFEKLVVHLRSQLPETRLAYVSMAIPPSRVQFKNQYLHANAMIRDFCRSNVKLDFIDVSGLLLDKQGSPRPEFYRADRLHMKPSGYARWTPVLRDYLEKHL
jgi:lysophospholipase L1-like esterase